MAKQAEIFDEVDRLRDEVRQLEQMGENLADRLTEERERNASLIAENERLQQSGDQGSAYPDWRLPEPNTIMGWCAFTGFFAMTTSTGMATGMDHPYYLADYVLGTAFRLSAQVLFLIWCLAILKGHGINGLFKRLGIWALAWAISVAYIASVGASIPDLRYRLIDMVFPTNWWIVPFQVSGEREVWVWMLFLLVADSVREFPAARWILRKVTSMIERFQGVMS